MHDDATITIYFSTLVYGNLLCWVQAKTFEPFSFPYLHTSILNQKSSLSLIIY